VVQVEAHSFRAGSEGGDEVVAKVAGQDDGSGKEGGRDGDPEEGETSSDQLLPRAGRRHTKLLLLMLSHGGAARADPPRPA
jgi:hypothetical protein